MDNSLSSNKSKIYYLDTLPKEIYHFYIFNNLDLDDLWNLRLVCRRFHHLIMSYNIYELAFLDIHTICGVNNWFSTTISTRPENQLNNSKSSLLKHPSNNLRNLKYLRIEKGTFDSFTELDLLNKFVKLQVLEIDKFFLNSEVHLQLLDLKALSIIATLKGPGKLRLSTPNLHSLSVLYTNKNLELIGNEIIINDLLSIKYILLNNYEKNILKFSNIECLEVCICDFDIDCIPKFKKLKALKCSHYCNESYGKLEHLFRTKKNDLELICVGVKIDEIGKITEYKGKKTELEFQLNNYNKLVNDINFVWVMNYDDLVRLFPHYQLSDVLAKFNNIQSLQINSKIENGSRLIQFITGCSNLCELSIKRSTLNQEFYDQFPVKKSLSLLIIENEKDLRLNFKFIMRLPYLKILHTDLDVRLSKELNLNNFKRLKVFKFEINNHEIVIDKEDKDFYRISSCEALDLLNKAYSHKRLVKWINWLRIKNGRETRLMSRKRKLELDF